MESDDLLAALPQDVAWRVLLLLPYDVRMRCSEVCTAWRELLKEPSLWSTIDFSQPDAFSVRLSRTFLLAVVNRAQGRLRSLTVSVCCNTDDDEEPEQSLVDARERRWREP